MGREGIKGRFRITSIIMAVAVIGIIVIGNFQLANPSDAVPAHTQATITNFTHQPVNGTFATTNTLTATGATIGAFSTDWGSIGLGAGWHQLFYPITYEGVSFTDYVSQIGFDVTWWNGSVANQFPFVNGVTAASNFRIILNDTDFAIYQRWVDSPTRWSGSTPEWNVTERITIFKHSPIVKLDCYIHNLNASSTLKQMRVSIGTYQAGAAPTRTYDDSMHQVWTVQPTYCINSLGGTTGAGTSTHARYYFRDFMMSQFINDTIDLETHAYVIFGASKTATSVIATQLGSTWNQNESATSLNLLVANNSLRYDQIKFFPASGYNYVPTSTSEMVYANGVETTPTFLANPILNYQRKPYIFAMDDLWNGLELPSVAWFLDAMSRYNIPTSFATLFKYPPTFSELYDMYNMTLLNHGTLLELTDHAYNHSSCAIYDTEEYAYDVFNLSNTQWRLVSPNDLVSQQLPFNAWGNGTWKGFADAGVKNLRLQVWGAYDQITRDLDSGLFITPAHFNNTTPLSMTKINNEGVAVGYVMEYHHAWSDMVTDPQRTIFIDFFKLLQNNTNIVPMTFSAFSDIWHHRISYSSVDGKYRIDLSNPSIQTNHRIRLATESGQARVFKDLMTGVPSYPVWLNSTEYYFDAEKGHVYEEIGMSVAVSGGSLLLNLTLYSSSAAHWTANSTTTPTVTFTLSGLENGTAYKVYIDGIFSEGLMATDGQIAFSHSSWSEHTFEVFQGDTLQILSTPDSEATLNDLYEYQLSWVHNTTVVITVISSLEGVLVDGSCIVAIPTEIGVYWINVTLTGYASETAWQNYTLYVFTPETPAYMFIWMGLVVTIVLGLALLIIGLPRKDPTYLLLSGLIWLLGGVFVFTSINAAWTLIMIGLGVIVLFEGGIRFATKV